MLPPASEKSGWIRKSMSPVPFLPPLDRYRDKLFVFLEHDGIPWNNNNAENAIKPFASRRKILQSSFIERGLQDYLVFLSIAQTCRNKHLSFLRFLLSGKL